MREDLLVGCYASESEPAIGAGLWALSLETDSGRLGEPRHLLDLPAASFLGRGPRLRERQVVYAVIETEPAGEVAAIELRADGARLLDRAPSGGSAPCHVLPLAEHNELVVANYGDGTLAVLALADDGTFGGLARHPGAGGGIDRERQAGPHAHQAALLPRAGSRVLAVCDLGADAVRLFDLGAGISELRPAPFAPGTGPRHAAVHENGTDVYITAELSGELLACRWDPVAATLTETHRVPASGAPRPAGAPLFPSHLAFGSHGVLYVANRGPGTLAAFRPQEGGPRLCAEHPAGMPWPRHFAIVPGSGPASGTDWLVVAGQGSGRVTVLAASGGDIAGPVASQRVAGAPACILPIG